MFINFLNYTNRAMNASNSLPLVPPISQRLHDSNDNLIVFDGKSQNYLKNPDMYFEDVSDNEQHNDAVSVVDAVVESDEPPRRDHEVSSASGDVSDDENEVDGYSEEVATDALPHFELTRRMHRLYSTISTGRNDDITDAVEVRLVCVNDLLFVAMCLEGGDQYSKLFATRLLQLGLVELCQQITAWFFSDRPRVAKLSSGLSLEEDTDNKTAKKLSKSVGKKLDRLKKSELRLVLSSVVNMTDLSVDACRRVVEIGFHKTLFDALKDPLNPDVVGTDFGHWHLNQADSIMSILYNVVQVVPEARELYRDENAVQILQKYRTKTSDEVSCMALILQSYVINAEENDLLGSAERSFVFLARELRWSVHDANHRSLNGYRASELLEAINKLAIVDSNKQRIVDSGVLKSYVKLLDVVGDNGKEFESSASIVSEQFAAAQGLWTLASTCPENVRGQAGCVEGLTKLLKTSVNEGVRRQARGALDAIGVVVKEQLQHTWNNNAERTIGYPQSPVSGADRMSLLSSVGHIFISYNHGSKTTCLRLRDRLRAAGYVIWIDADEMSDSIADGIISGLDRASVVLICMSQKYYESPYCKKEVIYAVESLKDIIPLTLEPRYKPHGWLKFHVSDRLQYDFSCDEQFDESFPKLVSALNKIFDPLIAKLADKDGGPLPVNQAPKSATTQLPVLTRQPPPPPSDHQPFTSAMPPFSNNHHHYSEPSVNGVATWSHEQVSSWLETNAMAHLRNSVFDGYDGEMLLELRILKSDAPETFAIFTDHELKAGRLNTTDILRLHKALRLLRYS